MGNTASVTRVGAGRIPPRLASPIYLQGLAAWIVEKFQEWSDCGDDIESSYSKDGRPSNPALPWARGRWLPRAPNDRFPKKTFVQIAPQRFGKPRLKMLAGA